MKKTVYRTFTWWNTDKEQAWLNDMIAQGWLLRDVRLMKYTFARCESKGYEICVQLLKKDAKDKQSAAYMSFVEETGAECIGARGSIAYFCKKKSNEPFVLFSDRASWLSYYRRIKKNMRWLLAMCVGFFVNDVLTVLSLCGGDTSLWGIEAFLMVLHVWFYCLVIPGHAKVRRLIRALEKDKEIFET